MNNENKMYIITVCGGEYEDSWTNIDSITDDMAKGQQYVDKMNKLSDDARLLKENADSYMIKYSKNNKAPQYNDEFSTVPVDSNGNKEKLVEVMKFYKEWMKVYNQVYKQYIKDNSSEELDNYMSKGKGHLIWFIEEAKWLKI